MLPTWESGESWLRKGAEASVSLLNQWFTPSTWQSPATVSLGAGWDPYSSSTSQLWPLPEQVSGHHSYQGSSHVARSCETVGSRWGPEWMCLVDTGPAMSRTLMPQTHGNGKASSQTAAAWRCSPRETSWDQLPRLLALQLCAVNLPPWFRGIK